MLNVALLAWGNLIARIGVVEGWCNMYFSYEWFSCAWELVRLTFLFFFFPFEKVRYLDIVNEMKLILMSM